MPETGGQGFLTADGRRPIVMIIDANRSTAAVATMLTEQFGCRSLPTSSVNAALRLLRGDQTIDLVLIDCGGADMTLAAAGWLIRNVDARGEIPLIAIGDDASSKAQSGERGLFAGTVTSPYSPRELFVALQTSLGIVSTSLTAP